jgi:hypothetical protein
MKVRVSLLDERYCPSTQAFADRQYRKLGLTDAVLLTLCPNVLVLCSTGLLYWAFWIVASRGEPTQ